MERKKWDFLPVRIQSKCSMSDQGIYYDPWEKQPSSRVKKNKNTQETNLDGHTPLITSWLNSRLLYKNKAALELGDP